jgi:hypothetical protein
MHREYLGDVRHCFDLVKDRAKYFSEIPKKGDIFFDPDRGILADAYPRFRHLTPTELFEIMNGEPARIVAEHKPTWRGHCECAAANIVTPR